MITLKELEKSTDYVVKFISRTTASCDIHKYLGMSFKQKSDIQKPYRTNTCGLISSGETKFFDLNKINRNA